jgi:MYXO-CTERM domain-containing protein
MRGLCAAIVAALLPASCAPSSPGDVQRVTEALSTTSVLTRNYGSQRSGANVAETTLDTTNVNTARFTRLFQVSVDDDVYASILISAGLPIQGSPRNVFFVATVNNSVYAFDADTGGAPLWMRNFNGAGRPTNPVEVGQVCDLYRNYRTHIGLVGTPVIDGATSTMYFVTRTVEGTATVQRLNALDITTGNPRAGSPVVIAADVAGSGFGSNGGRLAFDPLLHNQRAALALSGGKVHIAWASFCDTGNYHGWIMAYDAATLTQAGVWSSTPDSIGSGIWMGGAAPAIDGAGNLFYATGNGDFDGTTSFGEAVVKFAPATLARLDFFTPSNYSALNRNDDDLGSAGPIFLPGTSMLVTGGKEGKLYLLDSAHLGNLGDQNAAQSFQAVDTTRQPLQTHHIHNGMVTWQGPAGISVYVWGENDYLRRYQYNGAAKTLTVPASSVGSVLPPMGMPGGMMTISANGSTAGTGILWATTPSEGDANNFTVPGVLSAFNAETLSLLWQSRREEDDMGNFAKFNPPVVANGKVYMASFSNAISVYGLRATPMVNLALGRPATGTASPCLPGETPDKAFNDNLTDRWCTTAAAPQTLQVDLGSVQLVNKIIVRHAGAGNEDPKLDTSAFNLQVSVNGTDFTTVATVTGNTANTTTHTFAATNARFVRLQIVTATGTNDGAARIYELEVYGPPQIVSDGGAPDAPVDMTPPKPDGAPPDTMAPPPDAPVITTDARDAPVTPEAPVVSPDAPVGATDGPVAQNDALPDSVDATEDGPPNDVKAPPVDAGKRTDAARLPDTRPSDAADGKSPGGGGGGCSCALAEPESPGAGLTMLPALAFLAVLRRRRAGRGPL